MFDHRTTAGRHPTTVAAPAAGAWQAVARASGAGVAVAVLLVVLRRAGVLDGLPVLLVAFALALAFPTSRNLSRRLLLAGSLAFGAAPLLWLWDLPVGAVGRMTWVLSLAAAGLAAWVAWPDRTHRAARARSLLPSLRGADALPLVAAAGAAWTTASWWRVSGEAEALARLIPGWDNSAHFAMVSTIRRHGVTVDRLADLAGEHWAYVTYPQGFHTVAAAVMELLVGPTPGTAGDEAVAYVHATAWILVTACTMVAAGLAALPWVRRNPWPAVPAVLAVVVALALVPGGQAFVGGFPNFTLAAALAACVPLLAATMPRITMPVHVAALAALLVAVAQGWLLLLAIAGPSALVVTVRRGAWRGSQATWWWIAGILVAAIAGLAWVLNTLAEVDAGEMLVIPGGMVANEPRLMIAVAIVTPAALLLLGKVHRRLAWLATGPAAGLLAVALLGAYQMSTADGLSYYFWKLLLGLEIVDLVLIAFVWVRILGSWHPRRSGSAHVAVAIAGVAVLAGAVHMLGFTPGNGRLYAAHPSDVASAATVLSAAELAGTQALDAPPEQWTLVAAPAVSIHPMNGQQWLLALTGRWTLEAEGRARALLTLATDGDVGAAVRTALDHSPDALVIVPPDDLAAVQRTIGPADAARVVTWE